MSQKTYIMYYPGKTPDGKATYIEHPLGAAKDQEQAKAIAMGVVRALDIKDMHLLENPNELVFYSWPMTPKVG